MLWFPNGGNSKAMAAGAVAAVHPGELGMALRLGRSGLTERVSGTDLWKYPQFFPLVRREAEVYSLATLQIGL